jgi:hypothetical protein
MITAAVSGEVELPPLGVLPQSHEASARTKLPPLTASKSQAAETTATFLAKATFTSIPSWKEQPIDFARLVDLFTSKHSVNLYDRHAAALVRLATVYEHGFVSFIPDHPHSFRLLNHPINHGHALCSLDSVFHSMNLCRITRIWRFCWTFPRVP